MTDTQSIATDERSRFVSPALVAVADAETLIVSKVMPRTFVGVLLFDSNGDMIDEDSATGTTGTFAVKLMTENTRRWETPPGGGSIDAADPTTHSWGAPTMKVRVTPSSITGTATHYKSSFLSTKREG